MYLSIGLLNTTHIYLKFARTYFFKKSFRSDVFDEMCSKIGDLIKLK